MGVDILVGTVYRMGVDVMGVDVLGVDIMALIRLIKVGKNPSLLSKAQPSGNYWKNSGFTRVLPGNTGNIG